MTRRATFDGGWLELRDPKEITNGGRRDIRAAQASVAGQLSTLLNLVGEELDKLDLPDGQEPTDEQMATANGAATLRTSFTREQWVQMQELNDIALVAVIAKWSLSEPISLGTLADLPSDLADKITDAAKPAAAKAVMGKDVDFAPASDGAAPVFDTDLPFGSSTNSNASG